MARMLRDRVLAQVDQQQIIELASDLTVSTSKLRPRWTTASTTEISGSRYGSSMFCKFSSIISARFPDPRHSVQL